MSGNDSLGDRMKSYEQVTRTVLLPHSYTVLRVDGRAFHSYLRHALRPFDSDFQADMIVVAQKLCKEISGAEFAYGQSDEISVLVSDIQPQSQAWFGGVVQKQASGNYFLWRQRDAVRNSISMAAQAKFSTRELHGKSSGEMQEMLWAQHGINWNNYADTHKRGYVVTRYVKEGEVTYVDKRTGEQQTTVAMRSTWEAGPAPHFIVGEGFLAEMLDGGK